MQITNSSINPLTQQGSLAEQKQDAKQAQRELQEPSREKQATVPVQELYRKGELKAAERLEALDRAENVSPQAREALNQYQKTEQAGLEYEGGELVGIDVFV